MRHTFVGRAVIVAGAMAVACGSSGSSDAGGSGAKHCYQSADGKDCHCYQGERAGPPTDWSGAPYADVATCDGGERLCFTSSQIEPRCECHVRSCHERDAPPPAICQCDAETPSTPTDDVVPACRVPGDAKCCIVATQCTCGEICNGNPDSFVTIVPSCAPATFDGRAYKPTGRRCLLPSEL